MNPGYFDHLSQGRPGGPAAAARETITETSNSLTESCPARACDGERACTWQLEAIVTSVTVAAARGLPVEDRQGSTRQL